MVDVIYLILKKSCKVDILEMDKNMKTRMILNFVERRILLNFNFYIK
jgi:hypothetical protein